jgi:diadenosine tetraphosphatase ApaH/serine/threonine PP2A family protein phosphatase
VSTPTWPYVVGDIHGCLAELLELEAKVAQHAERHGARALVVAVGDLVDRGPDSAGVVRRFREGRSVGTHLAIVGNHDQEMLRVLADVRPDLFDGIGGPPRHLGPSFAAVHATGRRLARWLSLDEYRTYLRLNWIGQGGAAALASWGCNPHDAPSWRLPADDLAYLSSLPLFWEDERCVVTHALATAADLAALRAGATDPAAWATLAWAHAVHGALWNREPPARPPDPARVHVSGHTPLPRVRHVERANALMVDTGCVYGRRLTAWCAPTGDLLRVRSHQPPAEG